MTKQEIIMLKDLSRTKVLFTVEGFSPVMKVRAFTARGARKMAWQFGIAHCNSAIQNGIIYSSTSSKIRITYEKSGVSIVKKDKKSKKSK